MIGLIGFIGLGIMGSRMANNLLESGYDLIIYNRTKGKADPLLKEGAKWASSPEEVAKHADVIITMLPNPAIVEETATGANGFLHHMTEGNTWIDTSTVDPSFSIRMAETANKKGVHFLDAPVAGSKIPAEKGELVFLVGGTTEDVEKQRPLFMQMGKAVNHVGENGKGAAMKMVVNLMLGQAMAAFSEAIAFGEGIGLTRNQLFNTLIGGPVTAPFLTAKKEKMAADDFDAEFPLKWMHKDLELVAETAYRNGVALPSTNAVKEIYSLANHQGLGDEDFCAIYKLLTKTN